jgi:hypothetical protein
MLRAVDAKRRVRVLVTLMAAALAMCELQAQSPSLDVVLERLGAYLREYEANAMQLAADEQYEQWIKRRPGYGGDVVAKRQLKATFFLVRLPDGQAWVGLRDVISVNGRRVAAPERPIAQLLTEGTPDAIKEGMRISNDNAKYNIGSVFRTVNVPLQALGLLHPRNHSRFKFRLAGRDRLDGREAVIVRFDEFVIPSLVSDGFDGSVLSHGQAWIEASTGTVLRTELGFTGPALMLERMLIRVEYRRDNRVQIFVPVELEETYVLDIEVLHARANYRNYRRFETGARLLTQPQ